MMKFNILYSSSSSRIVNRLNVWKQDFALSPDLYDQALLPVEMQHTRVLQQGQTTVLRIFSHALLDRDSDQIMNTYCGIVQGGLVANQKLSFGVLDRDGAGKSCPVSTYPKQSNSISSA